MSKYQKSHVVLLVSAAVGAIAISMGARAQSVPPTTTADDTRTTATAGRDNGVAAQDEIVVTGLRASLQKSLDAKRNANTVLDVITAEDIGKFPDKNVADALQRVPGVIIDRDGGEGSRVSIRGLSPDLTLTELNGNFIASIDTPDVLGGNGTTDGTNARRSFNYLLLPSSLIASAEVYKSSEAKLDEGGVGGTIILRTRRPLDLKPWSGFISAEGTIADTTNKVEPQASGFLSWHNPADTFGVLVSVTYQERTNHRVGLAADWQWWTSDPVAQPPVDVNGKPIKTNAGNFPAANRGATPVYSGLWLPDSVIGSVRDEDRRRLGVQATAQWAPTPEFTLTGNYFGFKLNDDYKAYEVRIPDWMLSQGDYVVVKNERRNGLVDGGLTLDKSGTIGTGAVFSAFPGGVNGTRPPATLFQYPFLHGSYAKQETISNTFDVGAEYHHDNLSFTAKGGYTESTGGPKEFFSLGFYDFKIPYTDAASNFIPANNAATSASWNLATRKLSFSPELIKNLNSGVLFLEANDSRSIFTTSALNEKYFQGDLTRKFEGSILSSIDFGVKYRQNRISRHLYRNVWYEPGTTTDYTFDGNSTPTSFPIFQPNSIPLAGGKGFDSNVVPGIDFDAYRNFLQKTYGNPVRNEEAGFKYDVSEDILAGYLQANYKFRNFRGNLGLRVVNTRENDTVPLRLTTYLKFFDANMKILPPDQQYVTTNTSQTNGSNRTDFLPSFNIAWEPRHDIVVRAAVSKTIARPNFDQLGGSQDISFYTAAYAADRPTLTRAGYFGLGGNAQLKPFEAWQYDLGAEWYPTKQTLLGFTLFRKDVNNFIVPLTINATQVINGQTVTIQDYATLANGTNAVSQGVELFAQHTFPFGVGFFANFTYNDTNQAAVTFNGQSVGSSALIGSSKTQVNASVFYESDKILVRASYNRRGQRTDGIERGLTILTEPYQQLDLNAAYTFLRRFSITASVINLTEEEERTNLGGDTNARLRNNVYTGRRVYFGASYKF